MAHRKAGGSTRLGRDSISKRLGVKKFSQQKVTAGNDLVRQRGGKIRAGKNVKAGKDDTLYAVKSGIVRFIKRKKMGYDGRIKKSVMVTIEN